MKKLTQTVFVATIHATQFNTTSILMDIFSLLWDNSFFVLTAAPCNPAGKTTTANMLDDSLGGNVMVCAYTPPAFLYTVVGELPVSNCFFK